MVKRQRNIDPSSNYFNYQSTSNEYNESLKENNKNMNGYLKINKLFANRSASRSGIDAGYSSSYQEQPVSLINREMTPNPTIKRYLPIIPK